MSESNYWADFVRWAADRAVNRCGVEPDHECILGLRAIADLVSTRGEARVAMRCALSYTDDVFDLALSNYARETGRAPPAETRSVDVPPTGGRDALLRLAERMRLARETASGRASMWPDEKELRDGQVDAFAECEEMVRAAAEEL